MSRFATAKIILSIVVGYLRQRFDTMAHPYTPRRVARRDPVMASLRAVRVVAGWVVLFSPVAVLAAMVIGLIVVLW